MIQNNVNVVDLVIIGAGPGGVASAIEAKLAGIDNIVIIDKAETHHDMIHKFYKQGKRVDKDWMGNKFEFEGNVTFQECQKEQYLEDMEKQIQEAGIADKFIYGHEIIRTTQEENGLFDIVIGHGDIEKGHENLMAKNVILAVGRMGKPNKPKYKFPKAIRDRLDFNLSKVQRGERVMVVGGGDTAGEYAYGLVDYGIDCEVTLNYRKPEITRMNPTNTKITLEHLKSGKIRNKVGVDIESVEPTHDNKIQVNFTDGSIEEYDRAVYALGGTTPISLLVNSGIETGEWDVPHHNEKTMETNVAGLYAIGDIITDQGSIALSFNHAHFAVTDIASRLNLTSLMSKAS